MNNFFTECSYAKVNLGLKIINQRPDKYHNISSIFIQINLHDKLYFIPNKKFEIESQGIKSPLGEKNIVFKVAQILNKEFGINIKHKIIIDKNIPIGSGLGGGSSNAATALKVLANLYDLNISSNDYIKLANQLGSDVPFFINGGLQIAEGKGEQLSPASISLEDYTILLVCPDFSISTKWAYSFFKNNLPKSFNGNKFRTFQNNIDWLLFENDFEEVIKTTYPEVIEIRGKLEASEALFVSLSGSGSTMFGIFDDFSKANIAQQTLKPYFCHIVQPIIRK